MAIPAGYSVDLNPNSLKGVVANGQVVASWSASGPSGSILSQASNDKRPIFVENAVYEHGAVQFDGIDDGLIMNSAGQAIFNGLTGYSVYVMVKTNTVLGPNLATILHWTNGATINGTTRFHLSIDATATGNWSLSGRRIDTNSTQTVTGNVQAVAGQWTLVSAVVDFSVTTASLYVDGALAGQSTAFQTAGTMSATSSAGAEVGDTADSRTHYFNGQLARVLFYPTAHTATTRQAVEAELDLLYKTAGPTFDSADSLPATVFVGEIFNRTITASDTDGIASYAWSLAQQPGGSTATISVTNTATLSFVPDVVGVYRLRCDVTDGAGRSTYLEFNVTASAQLWFAASGTGLTPLDVVL